MFRPSSILALIWMACAVPHAQAQTFQFENGAEALFHPEEGAWYRSGPEAEWKIVHHNEIGAFESTAEATDGTLFAGESGSKFASGKKSVLTFFISKEGLFALNQHGKLAFLGNLFQLQLSNGQIYFEPHGQIVTAEGRKFRSIGVRFRQPNGKTTGRLAGVSEDLRMMSVGIRDLKEPSGEWDARFEASQPIVGPSVLTLRMVAENQIDLGRVFEDQWAKPDAFKLFRAHVSRTMLSPYVSKFSFYTALDSVHLPGDEEKTAEMRAILKEMLDESKASGRPSQRLLPPDRVQSMVNLINDQSMHGQVSGVARYRRITTTLAPMVNQWIDESQKVRAAMDQVGIMLLIQEKGRSLIVFHPRGTGAALQTTISECNATLTGTASAALTPAQP